ncbi:MAG: hypothetical protein JO020_01795 [Chloroflexi bacterium]|nr:hypothetical protein [Chloroflexota bacterium]
MIRSLTLRHVWVVITVGAAFIGPASNPIGLQDVLWTLLRGQWMADHATLITTDPFTSAPHIAGQTLNLQWLADLIYHGLDALGGLPMVIAGTALVVALTYGLVLAAAITASGHLRLSCVAVWGAYALGASNLSPRPQTLAYPLFAFFLLAVVRSEWRKDSRLLWALPFLTVVWANVHGSFFTGWALLGCAALGRVIATRNVWSAKPYVITLVACVIASAVTPAGVGSLFYLATMSGNQIVRDYVTEWAPTSFGLREGPLFFGSVAILCGLMLKSRRRLTPFEIILLLVFGYLAWSSVRAVVWWGLAMAPTLAGLLGDIFPARTQNGRNVPVLNALIIAMVGCLVVVSLPQNKAMVPILPADKLGVFSPETPVKLGEYLQTHDPPPTGKMLNAQGWGGYLEWATWPRHQVFLDGRIELHPDQVWLDYLEITFPSSRWRSLVDQYGISYFALDKMEQADLVADLRADAATWHLDYEDDQAVVFSRAPLSALATPP